MRIEFIKCHGSGNDFVLIDALTKHIPFSEEDMTLFTRQACDRSGAIGADGVLFALPSSIADARMRIFNADGSEPEMCGNGIRCVARKVSELLSKEELLIETMKTSLKTKKETDIFKDVQAFSVDISNVSLEAEDFRLLQTLKSRFIDRTIASLSREIKFSAISLGNPHIVALAMHPDKTLLELIGRKANTSNDIFPNGVNVSFFKKTSEQEIYVNTYERGVGITNSCGTAMSASGMISCMLGLNKMGVWIKVQNDGGFVRCLPYEKHGNYGVKLKGNATFVYKGTCDFANSKILHVEKENENRNETEAYNLLLQANKKSLNERTTL